MKIKIFAFVLALSMLLSMATACATNDKATDDNSDKEKVEYDGLVITDEYRVIRADSASKAVVKSAVYLCDQINAAASLNVTLTTDFVKRGEEIPTKEILIGKTSRETEFDKATLKEGEYFVGVEGTRLIIDAYDDETLYFAVIEIAKKWLTDGVGIQDDGVLLVNDQICQTMGGIDLTTHDSILVLSQNMRSGNDGNGNDIKDRAPRFRKLVEKYQPDIIGTQETTKSWNDYFKSYFKNEYGMVGCSRDGRNATSGEWNTILYRLDRFELLDSDTFWLSNTPEKKSVIDGSLCYRICTWALLKDKQTGKTVLMCNTHLDHGTDEVREAQCNILLNYIKTKLGDYPTYITGDYNFVPTSDGYRAMTKTWLDAHDEAIVDYSTTQLTFHSYDKPKKEIDFCFYNEKSTAISYYIVSDDFGGYVSDHYGVLTKFTVN